jgi:predicted regulator of Ras-like GTPase activity (Roadblock/LC7/MglB family)
LKTERETLAGASPCQQPTLEKIKEGARVSATEHAVHDLDWLVTDFVDRVRDVAHAVVVSADGLPMAYNARFPRDHADQLAAVTSGLASLCQGAARVFQAGRVVQTAVEMEAGLFVVMLISNGSSLAVLATSDCDLGLVAYEMSLMVERVGRELTPAPRQ